MPASSPCAIAKDEKQEWVGFALLAQVALPHRCRSSMNRGRRRLAETLGIVHARMHVHPPESVPIEVVVAQIRNSPRFVPGYFTVASSDAVVTA